MMNTSDPKRQNTDERVATDEGPQIGKKAYRKPLVQIYGTLAQVTNVGPHPASIRTDPAAPPSSGNRT
jgi:hypothetical protein